MYETGVEAETPVVVKSQVLPGGLRRMVVVLSVAPGARLTVHPELVKLSEFTHTVPLGIVSVSVAQHQHVQSSRQKTQSQKPKKETTKNNAKSKRKKSAQVLVGLLQITSSLGPGILAGYHVEVEVQAPFPIAVIEAAFARPKNDMMRSSAIMVID